MPSDTLFVRFRDYGFFVPTDSVSGKVAVIEGDLFLDTITVEMKNIMLKMRKSRRRNCCNYRTEYDINFITDGVIIKIEISTTTHIHFSLLRVVTPMNLKKS